MAEHDKRNMMVIAVLVAGFAIIALAARIYGPQMQARREAAEAAQDRPAPAQAQKSDEMMMRLSACEAAIRAVKDRLKAPATADFPSCAWSSRDWEIRANPDRTEVYVAGHVDAQNSFGAKLRQRFIVQLSRHGEGTRPSDFSAGQVAIE